MLHSAQTQLDATPTLAPMAFGRGHREDIVLARPPVDMLIAWPNVVGTLSVNLGDRVAQFQTTARPTDRTLSGELVEVSGSMGEGQFAFVLQQSTFLTFLRFVDNSITELPKDADDLALIAQWLLTGIISEIEAATGWTGTVDTVRPIDRAPSSMLLALEPVSAPGKDFILMGADRKLMAHLDGWTRNRADASIRNMSPELDVFVGPTLLPSEMVENLKPGQLIDLGIDPSGDVRGVLRRSDKSFWSVVVEDQGMSVRSALKAPLDPFPKPGLATALLRIGKTEIAPTDQIKLTSGHRARMTRLPGNTAALVFGGGYEYTGTLEVNHGSLCIRIK